MTARVTVQAEGERILAQTPFDAEFVEGAKRLAGKWRGGSWIFPGSQEARVRDLCRQVYGTDGSPGETATLRVRMNQDLSIERDGFRIGGRLLAKADGRDTGARLGEDVVLLRGDIGSGGSDQYWTTEVAAGTVFELLDMPLAAARAAENAQIGEFDCEIVEAPAVPEPGELLARRAKLLEQVAGIDTELQQLGAAPAGPTAGSRPGGGEGGSHYPYVLVPEGWHDSRGTDRDVAAAIHAIATVDRLAEDILEDPASSEINDVVMALTQYVEAGLSQKASGPWRWGEMRFAVTASGIEEIEERYEFEPSEPMDPA